jgi:6-phosphogluconolactonase
MRILPKLLVALVVVLALLSCSDIGLKGIIIQELGLGTQNTKSTAYYLYVTNYNTNSISGYSINTGTGALTQIAGSPFATGLAGWQPNQIAVDPKGNFLYVTADFLSTPGNVVVYSINASTGALTLVSNSTATGFTPQGIAVDPTGKFVYVANQGTSNVSAYMINTSTGALTSEGTANGIGMTGPVGVAVDSSGKYLYVTDNGAPNAVFGFAINTTTGTLTQLYGGAGFPAGSGPWSIAVDPAAGYVYVANQMSGNVSGYAITPSTGLLTGVPGQPFTAGPSPTGIAVDPTGKFVYVTNGNSATPSISAYTISSSNGALLPVAGSPFAENPGISPYGIVTDPTGKLAYVSGYYSSGPSNSLYTYTITPGTGVLSAVSGSPFLLGVANPGIAIATVTIP